MAGSFRVGRRQFFKQAIAATGAAIHPTGWTLAATPTPATAPPQPTPATAPPASKIAFPRVFTGDQLQMIAFPLGGVCAGTLSLGGRGQLRDWQIFNKASQNAAIPYGFPSVFVQAGDGKPIARVLESRILPPYEGPQGLGAWNCVGLPRLAAATFTGAYPLAQIDFHDDTLPVQIALEAFSPFIPHDPEDSGLPVAVLRYRVTNPGPASARVGIAFSIENPIKGDHQTWRNPTGRLNEYRSSPALDGLVMTNPSLAPDDPMHGSFVLGVLPSPGAETTYWRGWKQDNWLNPPMLFCDAFSRDGRLLDEPSPRNLVGALCQTAIVPAGATREVTFLLAWHFPNRTPHRMLWESPAGQGDTILGNHYTTRFADAWTAAQYTAANLPSLEARTREFTDAFAASTLPDVVKDAASANLSTLASTTCFRTAAGDFYGFEGADDHAGSCYGNSTHVWNYETVTAHLFPTFSRSLRKSSFFDNMTHQGGIPLRLMLPLSAERTALIPADGQMGQIIHAYLDWRLSGDSAWLNTFWPRIKLALEYAWIDWDADRDGVMEGKQDNTYDVAFFGPNPLCGIYYLGALRAAEEMARALADDASANRYRALFDKGSQWIDANLFNGEYYFQDVRSAPGKPYPEYQVGKGCLIDQLTGQYLAHVAGLGDLVSPQHARASLEAVHRYNFKHTLVDHICVERTYALNDEPAVLICSYGKAARPEIPFPYYSEAWTGLEYSTAAMMFYAGMVPQGLEFIETARSRFDGIRRNPWDECEAGHHYVRPLSSWSSIVALSGFQYQGDRAHITAIPRLPNNPFQCLWATGTGWGTFTLTRAANGTTRFALRVIAGSRPCVSCQLPGRATKASAKVGANTYSPLLEAHDTHLTLRLPERQTIRPGTSLEITLT